MDPGWYYNRLPGQHVVGSSGSSVGAPGLGTASVAGASAGDAVIQPGAYAAAQQHPSFLLAQQIR